MQLLLLEHDLIESHRQMTTTARLRAHVIPPRPLLLICDSVKPLGQLICKLATFSLLHCPWLDYLRALAQARQVKVRVRCMTSFLPRYRCMDRGNFSTGVHDGFLELEFFAFVGSAFATSLVRRHFALILKSFHFSVHHSILIHKLPLHLLERHKRLSASRSPDISLQL